MYADQMEAQSNRSIKERLNVNSATDSGRRRLISGKRPREDDEKWEHDLLEDSAHQFSNHRVGVNDLRLKLQRKNYNQTAQGMRGTVSGVTRDLREKISAILSSSPAKPTPLSLKSKPAHNANKPPRKSLMAEAIAPETKIIASSVSKKKSQQTVDSVDNFMKSLGLQKYSITFQAEEVDMAALVHMSDEDLKALGIPMGPRKKIFLALESRVE